MKRMVMPAAGLALLQAMGMQSALADANWDRYAASGYVYCDAVILGIFWNQSVDAAKATIGRKLGFGNASIIQGNLGQARRLGHRCTFQDTGFAYEDAEAVAALWGVDVEVAKGRLADKLSTGLTAQANQAVAEARAAQTGSDESDSSEDYERYAESEYEYCDAVILGNYWGESVDEAKITIGRKLGFGNDDIIQANRQEARDQGQRCDFVDTGFSYEDAEAVAALWDVSIDDAKAALADKVSLGDRELANDVVAEANGG